MIFEILTDFINGIINSMRIDAMIYYLITNFKIRKIMLKICVAEFFVLVFTHLMIFLTSYQDGGIITTFIKMINGLFIFLSTIEFISAIDTPNNSKNKVIDVVSTIVTMSVYQISMMILVSIINYLLFSVSFILNYFILAIYYSFYSYNNLWQKKGINVKSRINMYECRWAYYVGYGTLPTIIYLCSYNIYLASLRDLYLFISIIIPFYVMEPIEKYTYPKINMKIFIYVCEWMMYVINYVVLNKN